MLSACAIKVLWPRKGSVRKPSKTVDLKLFQHKLNIVVLMKLSLGWNVDICTASLCLLIHIYFLLPPFQKSRNASPQSTVTGSLGSFLRMTTRSPVLTMGLHRVSSARAHGRADEAGPSLSRDVEQASAGNGRAQSSVPNFMEQRKCYYATMPCVCGRPAQ